MKSIQKYVCLACMAASLTWLTGAAYAAGNLEIRHLGEGQSIVRLESPSRYLLLPVQESSPESKLYMIVDNDVVKTMNVRLAADKVDYFVPVDLAGYAGKNISFNFQLTPEASVCWKEMTRSIRPTAKISVRFTISARPTAG